MERQFKVGDVCRVRQWDDMANEFGLDEYGDINIIPSFVSDMKFMCGHQFTISDIPQPPRNAPYRSVGNIEAQNAITYWYVSADMLEPIESTTKITPHTAKEMDDFLFCN